MTQWVKLENKLVNLDEVQWIDVSDSADPRVWFKGAKEPIAIGRDDIAEIEEALDFVRSRSHGFREETRRLLDDSNENQ